MISIAQKPLVIANVFKQLTFWKLYAGFFVGLGFAALFDPTTYTAFGAVDYLISLAAAVMLVAYAFRKRFGPSLAWKLLAIGYALDSVYSLYITPADNNVQPLSAEGILTIMLLAALMAPSVIAPFAYAWGRLAPVKRDRQARPKVAAQPAATVAPATAAQSETAAAPIAKPRTKWTVILQPLAGVGIAAGLLLCGLMAWIGLNGGNQAAKLFDAQPLYVLLLTDHMDYWLLAGTAIILALAHRKRTFRTGAYTLLTLLLLATAGNLYLHTRFNDRALTPAAFATQIDPSFKLDPRLAELAGEVGIDSDNLKRAKAQVGRPPLTETLGGCSGTDVIGCTTEQGIYIFPDAFTEDRAHQRSTLAHEYLHWVWHHASPSQQQRLTPYLNIVYGKHHDWFDARTPDGLGTGQQPGSDLYTDELDSYIGTEADPQLLPSELNDWYNQWLHNRSTLPHDLSSPAKS